MNLGHPKALFPTRCLDSALAVRAGGLDALVVCIKSRVSSWIGIPSESFARRVDT